MKQPVPADLYDNDYYKKYNHGYDTFESKGDIMPELKAKFDKTDFTGKKILDVGCGRGEFVSYALIKGARQAIGIDYSQASVDISKKFLEQQFPDKQGLYQITRMDAKKLDFDDESFDIVVLLDIVEHLHDWELKQCVSEVYRILKKGGTIYVHTSPNKIVMSTVRFLAGIVGIKLMSQQFHVNEQTYFSLKKYFNKLFIGNYILDKDKKYWTNQMVFRGPTLKKIAQITDNILDFPIVHKIMSIAPLNIIFCSDLWFIGKKITG